jgi:hypothetical protein
LPKCTATGWGGLCCSAPARGDHHPDSNYDAAVFIKDPGTLTEEPDKLASLTTAILLDTGAVNKFGAVCWPKGPDLAPDAMYSELIAEPTPQSRPQREKTDRSAGAKPRAGRQIAPRTRALSRLSLIAAVI